MHTEHWTSLRDGVAGALLLPGDPGFDVAVRARPFVAHDGVPAPAAVLRCRDAADVAAAVGFARRHALPVAVRSGGHCSAGLSSTSGLVIDVSLMDTVEVDAGRVVVGGGVRLAGLVEALAAHGRALPAGTCPTVGVSGLTLGGGWGMLSRQHGLTCDFLVGAEVVTADGAVVVADERHEPDLFWALRGGGTGGLGVVVTSMTFRTLPAPRMTTFVYAWPVASASGVLRAWLDRAVDAPARLCAEAGLYTDEVRLHGAMAGSRAETRAWLARLCDGLAPPMRVKVVESSYLQSARRLAGEVGASDPSLHLYATSEFFADPLPAEAVDALLVRFASGPAQREIGFLPWAGRDHVAPDATAFPHRRARYVIHHIAVAADADADVRTWVRDMRDTLHPYGTGGVYANFADPGLTDWERAYYGDNAARLRAVKRRYDPDGVFRTAQSVR